MKGYEMKMADYKRLKKEVDEKYQKAIEKAEKDRIEAIAAIEKVWRMFHPRRSRATNNMNSTPSHYGTLVDTVRKSLEYVPKRFTKKNVLTAMEQISNEVAKSCNPNSLSGCMHRLKKDGVIIEVKKGKGSMPTEYELANNRTEIGETRKESKEQQNVR
jgi:DNA polymerase elongation subunit (family B)